MTWLPLAELLLHPLTGRAVALAPALDHAQLQQRALCLAGALQARGVQRVALYLEDAGELAIALLGAWRAGAAVLLPADATQPAAAASQEDLLAYLGHLSATDLDLPLLARVRDQLKQVCQGVPLDFRELGEAWQHDPALCAYLIAAANSAAYGVAGQVCVGLPDALKRLGGRTSLNLAVALALRQACTEDDTLPSLLLREHLEAAERLADQVVALARQAGIDPAPLQVAALLHRMGELCVLLQSQRWASQGHALDDRVLGRAIGDFARPFAIALKSQWGLPIALRELIGAIYALPQVQFRREQVLMRLAAALCNGEPPATVERLRRLAGLG